MSEREFRESMQERWNAEVLELLHAIRKLLEKLTDASKITELETSLRQTVGVLDGTVSAMGRAKIVERAYKALGKRS